MKNRAFTLIELLVVVLIIGILAAVALPQYQKAVEKSRLAEALSNIRVLENSMAVYILENGYPSTGTIKFLGDKASAILPADIVTIRRRANASYDKHAETNYFAYDAYCGDGFCDILADRIESDGTRHYRLHRRIYSGGKLKICSTVNNSSLGERICGLLNKDGWSLGNNIDE